VTDTVSNRLAPILAATREEVARRREAVPLAQLERAASERAASEGVRSFPGALARPGLSVIAEHKRRSPSAGAIREDLVLEDVVAAYERGGAAALSVLTEGPSFGGSLDDLRAARAAVRMPLLRKDFIVDPYQVQESFAAGADAILLIVAALSPRQLASLHTEALGLGLSALVEVHDERELDGALALAAPVIGINNRDLTTLEVDTRRTFELAPRVDGRALVVAESGFSAPAELDELAQAGIDAVLIGEALMRSPDVESACRALTSRRPAAARTPGAPAAP
jgi:indole-3-glycerol phosphate synthase